MNTFWKVWELVLQLTCKMDTGCEHDLNIQSESQGGERKKKKRKFVAGILYNSPYKPPGHAPKGYNWQVAERHIEKKYPISWALQSIEPEFPSMDDLPPVDENGREIRDFQLPLKGFNEK